MLPYFLLLLISAVSPFVIYQGKGFPVGDEYERLMQKRNRLTVFLFFIGLFILLSLRDITVGKDLIVYRNLYEVCSLTPFNELHLLQWEIGYTAYNKLIAMLGADYRIFLIITALISLLPVYILYSKEKRYSLLLIALFINMPCFLMVFSGLRQAIATSIGILVYFLLEKKNYILGALLIVIAMCFHVSAAVLILFYPMLFLKIKAKHLIFVTPVMILMYIFRVRIFTFLFEFLPSKYTDFYGEIQQTGAFGMLLLFLIFCVFSFVILDENRMSKKDFFMRNILFVATMFQIFVSIHGLIQRASYYFLIFVPIAILSIVQAPKRRLKNVSDMAVIVMGCFFILYFFYNAVFSTDNLLDVFPYKFFWSGSGW